MRRVLAPLALGLALASLAGACVWDSNPLIGLAFTLALVAWVLEPPKYPPCGGVCA